MIPSLFFSEEKIDICLKNISGRADSCFSSVNIDKLREKNDILGGAVLTDYFLTETEKKTYKKFSYEKRRMEWLAGRIAAKTAVINLSAHLLKESKEKNQWLQLEIAADEGGRPFVLSGPGLRPDISISHSGCFAVAAAVEKGVCGLDIQKISTKISKVEKKFIGQDELALINEISLLSHLSREEFLTLVWSAKEALRKGSGRSNPLLGFLEARLIEAEEEKGGFVFRFFCKRDLEKNQVENFLTTKQAISGDYAISLMFQNGNNKREGGTQ